MSDESELKLINAELTAAASEQQGAAASLEPRPASASTGPKSGTGSPLYATPEPKSASGSPVLKSASGSPMSGSPVSKSASGSPVSATPEPKSATGSPVSASPVSRTPEPKPVSASPVSRTPEPKSANGSPVSGTPEPKPVSASPVSGTPEPKSVSVSPVSGTPEPKSANGSPVSGTPEPTPVSDSTLSGTPDPKLTSSSPVSGTPEPTPVSDSPVSGTPELTPVSDSPVSGTPELTSVSDSPVSGTPEPKLASGSQVSGRPVPVAVALKPVPDTPDLEPISNGKEHAEANKGSQYEGDVDEDEAPSNIAEVEDQQKKLPYPKSVFFIISNEFCERFTYYGMRTVLVLYLSHQLNYSDDTATVIFHVFTMFVYFLCILGAIISDSWLGKFRTILYLSLVYVCGSVILTLGAIGPLNLPTVTFTMIGLALIALGSGGIKPCVSAFGGDQFKLPQQVKQMTTFFSLFYFSINAGSLISTTITPILREDVHCFGEKECYSLAFGVPAVLMCVSIVIFVLGRPLYNSKPPSGNMVVLVSRTIACAIATRWKEKNTNPREHWLDYADGQFDKQLIEDVKVLARVLFLYLPLPVFWALFDQQGSRWTFQAARMDGDMGTWDIKPDQLQVMNPLLILIFIPLYDLVLYPLLSLVGIRRPLQKLTLGGILAGLAFVISGIVELKLEQTYPITPKAGFTQVRIFSADPNCIYNFTTNLDTLDSNFTMSGIDYYEQKIVETQDGAFILKYSIDAFGTGCVMSGSGSRILEEGKAYSLFLRPAQKQSIYWYEDRVEKSLNGKPLVRTLANIPAKHRIVWRESKTDNPGYNETARNPQLYELSATNYKVFVEDTTNGQGEVLVHEIRLRQGGVYALVIGTDLNTTISHMYEVTPPNSMSILWLIPQYVLMTLAEVMFSVTGLQFSYSQAPETMNAVLQAWWLLTVAFGNVIVVIIAKLKFFDSQAYEFFFYAALMFADMAIFIWMSYNYVPKTLVQVQSNRALDVENMKMLEDAGNPQPRDSVSSLSIISNFDGELISTL